jgi:catechol 2,3-dioxygenase-like lactoylglutathione lyase family enzyme
MSGVGSDDLLSGILDNLSTSLPQSPSMKINPVLTGATALLLLALGSATSATAQAPADNPLRLSAPRTVTIVVADLNKEVEWYEKVLGFHESVKIPAIDPNATEQVGRIELAGFRLHLVVHKGSRRPAPLKDYRPGDNALQGMSHFSFESTNLDEISKWLMAHGVEVQEIRVQNSNALRMMRFSDPEGNEIHIELPN